MPVSSLFAEVRWMLLKVVYIPVINLKCAGLYGCRVEFLTPSFLFQSDITDINEIFKDLGMMVHEQGDLIGECSHAV